MKSVEQTNAVEGAGSDPRRFAQGYRMAFPDRRVEREFRRVRAEQSLPRLRVAAVLGLLLFGGFGVLDVALTPERAPLFWTIRFGVVCPLIAAGLAATFVRAVQAHLHAVFGFLVALAGVGIAVMLAHADPLVGSIYFSGLLLVLMFGATLIRLRFACACLSTAAIVAAYEIVAVGYADTSPDVIFGHNFFLLSAALLSTLASYQQERCVRRDFDQIRTIKAHAGQLARLNDRLARLSTRDHLTGLYNRRHLDQRLGELIALHKRYDVTTTLLLIDLDGFKAVNDLYGHPAGDRLLRQVGEILQRGILRETDMAFRFGGDEFLIALPNTDYEAVERLVVTLKEALSALEVDEGRAAVGIGFSGGALRLSAEISDANETIAALDRLLDRAKAAGRGATLYGPRLCAARDLAANASPD